MAVCIEGGGDETSMYEFWNSDSMVIFIFKQWIDSESERHMYYDSAQPLT